MSSTPGEPEYLGSEPPTTAPPGGPTGSPRPTARRAGALVAAVVGVAAAVGAGTYGVLQLMSGGSSPATAVPATAVAYVSLDLDPSAGQKIEAVRILRKFPALRSELGISSRDDLRKVVFRAAQRDGGCRSLDYERDVEPWIGERVALAAVPGSGKRVLPLVALQVTDHDAARAGVRKVAACSGDDALGVAVSGDYLLLTERQRDADAVARSVETADLADAPDFGTWTSRTGDPGILTMYVATGAADALAEAAGTQAGQVRAAFKDFAGAAGVVRFHDGAVEAEFASGGLAPGSSRTGDGPGTDVGSLPATTGAVLSVALEDGWLDSTLDGARSSVGAEALDSGIREVERETGLQLPEDLEALLGRGFSVSVDSGLDPGSLRASPDPARIPAGIRITGDPRRITAVIDKLRKAAGPSADVVRVATSGDAVAVGTDQEYVDSLLEKGTLGDSEAFRKVVPQSGRARGVFFLDFDAGDGWAEQVAELLDDSGDSGDRAAVRENVAPLDALGLSSWQDGDEVQHALLRLTTD